MLSVNTKEIEITENAHALIKAIESIKNLSNRNLRNTLYKYGYTQNYDFGAEYDVGIIENLTRHL